MVDKSVLFLDRVAKIIGRLEEDEVSWQSILEAFGFEHLLETNDRLLRSQHFGDEDYTWCITNILKEAYNENPQETKQMINHILKHDLIHKNDISILEEALDNYPGLNDFLREDISSSDAIHDENLSKSSVKVFISYSMKDKHVGAKIKEILASFGIECFMAHDDIGVSEEWKKRILNELNEADIFIPILSKNFKNSDWCSQEAGIACYRNILFIPLKLDNDVNPFGFMSHRQGKLISRKNIPLNLLVNPIRDNFPKVNIFSNLIDELKDVKNFNTAQRLMRNLVPYFDRLSDYEIDRLVKISIANNQIYKEGMCRREYLPKLIQINKDKIEDSDIRKLSEKIGYEIIGDDTVDKWADYCISHVKYNPEKTHIVQVRVREDLGDKLANPIDWSRIDVLNSLKNGKSFCTIIEGTDDWKKGAMVRKVIINNIEYIKTKRDSIENDNLGTLPQY